MALVVQLFIITRTVCPAAVVALIAVLRPVVIIECTHFVTQVNQRQTAGTQSNAVQKFDAVNGVRVILSQTNQCCGCTADTAVASVGVVLEGEAAREAAVEMVDEEAVEELSVVVAVDAELPCVLIGKCPADVVMAADVVDPCSVVGQVVAVGQCLMEQVDFARGKRVPQQCHLQRVVTDLAFVLADVLDNLVGVDDGFGFEEHGRGGNTHYGVKRTNQGMCLRQVFAACAHLLPNKGNGIHA